MVLLTSLCLRFLIKYGIKIRIIFSHCCFESTANELNLAKIFSGVGGSSFLDMLSRTIFSI